MPVDTEYGCPAGGDCPRCSGSACSAADIQNQPRRRYVSVERAHDEVCGEKVKGTVEQGKRGALAGAVERPTDGGLAALDIRARQRSQGSCDFREAQIREVSRVELGEPATKCRRIFDVQWRPSV